MIELSGGQLFVQLVLEWVNFLSGVTALRDVVVVGSDYSFCDISLREIYECVGVCVYGCVWVGGSLRG